MYQVYFYRHSGYSYPVTFLNKKNNFIWYTGWVVEYKRNPNTNCYVCRAPIYRRPSQIERTNSRAYCSQSCYGIYCRKEKPCKICGKPILASLHKKTCSRGCANTNRVGIKYGRGRPKDKVVNYLAIKKRLVEKKGPRCERCGYDRYDILQVHHRDRNRSNNKLDNLGLLCPNCHYEDHFLERNPQ